MCAPKLALSVTLEEADHLNGCEREGTCGVAAANTPGLLMLNAVTSSCAAVPRSAYVTTPLYGTGASPPLAAGAADVAAVLCAAAAPPSDRRFREECRLSREECRRTVDMIAEPSPPIPVQMQASSLTDGAKIFRAPASERCVITRGRPSRLVG